MSKGHKILFSKIWDSKFFHLLYHFSNFGKKFFMYFGHKLVETGPNCSHELATFLKYHMPLRLDTFFDKISLGYWVAKSEYLYYIFLSLTKESG